MIFLGIGVYCLFWTRHCAQALGVGLLSPQGLTDFRATYAGMCLACGALFAMVFLRPESITSASFLSLFVYAGLGATRAYGMFFNQGATPMMWSFLVTEIVFAAWSVVAIRQS